MEAVNKTTGVLVKPVPEGQSGKGLKESKNRDLRDPKKRKRRKRLIFIAAAVVVILAVALVLVFGVFANQTASGEPVIQEATVQEGDLSTTIEGTGVLSSSSSIDVLVPSGIEVEEVRVSPGDQVAEGDILATVDSVSLNYELYTAQERLDELASEISYTSSSTAAYYKLLKEQQDVQEAHDILSRMAEGNAIVATTAGVIGTVNVSAGSSVADGASSSDDASNGDDSSGGYLPASYTEFSDTDSAAADSDADSTSDSSGAESTTADSDADSTTDSSGADSTTADRAITAAFTTADLTADADPTTTDLGLLSYKEDGTLVQVADLEAEAEGDIEIAAVNLSDAKLTPTVKGTPVIQVEPASNRGYLGMVSWTPADSSFKEGVAYTAEVILTPLEGYSFAAAVKISLAGAEEISYELQQSGELKVTVVYPKLVAEEAPVPTDPVPTENDTEKVPKTNTDSDSNSPSTNDPNANGSDNTAGALSSGDSSGSTPSGSSMSSSGASNDTTTSTDNSELTSAFAISSGDTASLTVSVDELDILSVEEGQSVQVTLDALEDQVFEGEITGMNKTGTSSGGVTKYSVEVTLPKDEQMLEGMNASVSIIIKESAGLLLIPSAALQQEGTQTYVYTEKDENTGELAGRVDVETGESNGTRVAITSGLSAGDTVYYQSIEADGSQNAGGFVMSGGPMGGGQMPEGFDPGNMPEMPEGGFSGGNRSFGDTSGRSTGSNGGS